MTYKPDCQEARPRLMALWHGERPDRPWIAATAPLPGQGSASAPAFVMIDDDFRIAFHTPAHKGCMCPLHLERFAGVTGTERTRESLLAALREERGIELRDPREELKRESLVELAAAIRAAVDSVDPSIPGSLCMVVAVTDSPERPAASPCAMSGTAAFGFDDEQMLEAPGGPLLLDGEAARHLCYRGFGEQLGVRVGNTPFPATAELMHFMPESGRRVQTMTGLTGGGRYMLKLSAAESRIASSFVSGTRSRPTVGSPALTWHENGMGGRVAVYELSMKANIDWVLFNGGRRRQLLETLAWLGGGSGPVVAQTDLDALLLHGRDSAEAGVQYLFLLDLNPDTIEGCTFRLPGGKIDSIERLSTNGQSQRVGFTREGEELRCVTDASTMEPVLLRLSGGARA